MKIYFAGSIRGGREDREIYFSLIQELRKYGTVLTEHFGHESLTDQGDKDVTVEDIYNRDMDWVREADVIVAEVTVPSLGVGYEIGQAEAMKKPVAAFYRQIEGKSLSAMIAGNSYINLFKYSDLTDATQQFETFFKSLEVSE
jgi:nucleoside 2-deoxyribosyltransferase